MNIVISNYMKGIQRTLKYISLLDQFRDIQENCGDDVLSYVLIITLARLVNGKSYGSDLSMKHDIRILYKLGLVGCTNHLTTQGKELTSQLNINHITHSHKVGSLQKAYKNWQVFKSMPIMIKIVYAIGVLLLVYMGIGAIVISGVIALHPAFADIPLVLSIFVAEIIGLSLTIPFYKMYDRSSRYRSSLNNDINSNFTESDFIMFLLNHNLIVKHLDQLDSSLRNFNAMFTKKPKDR